MKQALEKHSDNCGVFESSIMKILGFFKYHIYEVRLEGTEDETRYDITKTENSLCGGEYKPPLVNILSFTDLSPARTEFEKTVEQVIYKTSLSDVSLYQQQS